MPNPIAFAIPLFFVFIGLELFVARRRGMSVYRFGDSVVDLSSGILQQVCGLATSAAQLVLYTAAYDRRLVTFAEGSIWPWILAFVGVDFLYYWWHRLSHEVNILWAAHVVHHQSEEYNLTVALRQSITTSWTAFPFYVPLAFLGVPVLPFALSLSISTLYQFWIHTRVIAKVPGIEGVLNTPSAHRVHHAVNPRYLDRNHGGILMIWDRLFGTWEPEGEACVYGLVKPLANFQPLWAQFHYFAEIWTLSRLAPRFADKVWAWFASPEWRPRDTPPCPPAPQVRPEDQRKYAPPLSPARARYLFAQLVFVIVATFSLVMWGAAWSVAARVAMGAGVVLAVFAMGALLESSKRLVAIEWIRWSIVVSMAFALAPLGLAIPLAVVAVSQTAWISRLSDAPATAPAGV